MSPNISIINRILELSGPVANPEAYRRYLAALPAEQLQQKCLDLQADKKARTEPAAFWRPRSITVATSIS